MMPLQAIRAKRKEATKAAIAALIAVNPASITITTNRISLQDSNPPASLRYKGSEPDHKGKEKDGERMNPSRPFILRPVATSLLMVAILLVGLVAFKFLPLSALPEVDYPTIQIQTFYPGASPDVMNSSVTAPLERQLGEMPGLKQMSSASSAGACVVTLQFDLSLSLPISPSRKCRRPLTRRAICCPSDLPAPPIYAKVNPADAPVLALAVTSKTLPLTDVEDMADTRLAEKISQLPGVGLVSISGGQRPAVHIQANPQALAAYGLNIDDLRTTISTANVNTPKGNFDGPTRDYTINANDQIQAPADYMKIIVAYKNGAPVHLSDVADEVVPGRGEPKNCRPGPIRRPPLS